MPLGTFPSLKVTSRLLLALALVVAQPFNARADAPSELGSFSVFDKVDLAQLAGSDVKTAHGVPMSTARYISVQSCYVSPRSPAQEIAAMRNWSPAQHPELRIYQHGDINGAPAANFARLRSAPDNSAVRSLVAATQKMSSDLQLSNDEAKRFNAGAPATGGGAMPAPIAAFWSDVLAGRAQAFLAGG
ncbi:MAG: hypothetical protein ABI871_08120, partial [Chthoniobacterales bacterium]